MAEKAKTPKQAQLDENRRKALADLQSVLGAKAPVATAMKLVAHRRAGKNNAEFFAALETAKAAKAGEAGVVAGATEAAAEVVQSAVQNAHFAKAKNNLTRRLAPTGKKPAGGLIHKLAALRRKGKPDAEFFSALNAALAAKGVAVGKEAVQTAAVEAAVEAANNVVKAVSGHVAAGKKAATSEKGSAWLSNVKKGQANLTDALKKIGVEKKASGKAAIQYASLMRKNAAAAANFKKSFLNAAGTRKNNSPKKNKTAKAAKGFVERNIRPAPLLNKTVRRYGATNVANRPPAKNYRGNISPFGFF